MKAQRVGGDVAKPELELLLALQDWLAQVGKRRVIVPFAEKLAGLVSDCIVPDVQIRRHFDHLDIVPDVRIRRDFDQLLTCVQTLAILHQTHRPTASGGEIVATIADYREARFLLKQSFEMTAEEGPTGAIRETVLAIGQDEADVSEVELARRLERTKQAISWRVIRALRDGWLINDEQRSGKAYRLKRGKKLPWPACPLPGWQAIEQPIEEVPEPEPTARLFGFATTLVEQWPAGVTVTEWMAGGTVDLAGTSLDDNAVRARFEALRDAGLLEHDPKTDRYAPSSAMRHWLKDPTKAPLRADLFAAWLSDQQSVGETVSGESNSSRHA